MKGRKTGGRRRGVKNKATLEKERIAQEIAERTIADARSGDKKLAKDVLEECMNVLGGMAAMYQPAPPGHPPKPGADLEKFFKTIDLTMYAAKELAKYQSPQFKSVEVGPMSPDSERPLKPGDNAKVINLKDPKVVMRTYLEIVRGPLPAAKKK